MNDIEFDVTTINFAWPGFSAHDATNILVRYAMQLSLQYAYVPNSGRYMHINFNSRMPLGSIAVRQDRQMDGVSYGYDIKEFERSKTPREDWIDLIAEVLIQFATVTNVRLNQWNTLELRKKVTVPTQKSFAQIFGFNTKNT